MCRRLRFAFMIVPALAWTGCDVVDEPLQEGPGPGPGPGVTARRVLLEDMTGHTCNNCPSAAQVALQLQGVYGEDQLILVGVHCVDGFAAPVPPIGDGMFDTDFRTPAGNAYATEFGITFLPAGLVSRREFNGSQVLSQGSWSSAVADIIGQPADLDVWFEGFSFNSGTGQVTTTVKAAVLNDLVGDYDLTVYLTEDHVIDWQIDNQASPPNVPNYDHRHVLRDNLNGTWGEDAIVGGASAGDTLTFDFNYALASNVLDPDNCALVAYIYRTLDHEVLQVAEHKFQP